ncbi:MAG: LamG domain-containing protein [Bacteroidia bacterium]|nr:LamG domain-containing protein [Bacteroidia bacterium]
MNKIKIRLVFSLLIVGCSSSAFAQKKPIVFVCAPDWHGVNTVSEMAGTYSSATWNIALNEMATFKPDFCMIPGDFGGQDNWYTDADKAKYLPNAKSAKEVIDYISGVCYPALKARFQAKGVYPIIAAVGDHEIGDNDWPEGVAKSFAVPFFRAAFVRHFFQNEDSSYRYSSPIGTIPCRPMGTPYEGSSFAAQFGNLLVVSVDVFRQDDPMLKICTKGSVAGEVVGTHLQWLDNLLGEARLSSDIQFIIVQGHLPVLPPVRAKNSSTMYVANYEQSLFWKVLQKHKVDFYFAGEVHSPTAILDKDSETIQIVSGGPIALSYLLGQVDQNHVSITLREMDGNSNYSEIGKIDLNIVNGKKQISSEGLLSFVDQEGMVLNFQFEDANISTTAINNGSYAKYFNGTQTAIGHSEGVLGQAATFSGSSYIVCPGSNTVFANEARSVTAWIKTTSSSEGILSLSGKSTQFFKFRVTNGILSLAINGSQQAIADQGTLKINDNKWHHVVVVLPFRDAKLDEVKFYIDGVKFNATSSTPPNISINTPPGVHKPVIGGGYVTNNVPANPKFVGSMDDYGFWNQDLRNRWLKLFLIWLRANLNTTVLNWIRFSASIEREMEASRSMILNGTIQRI